MREKKKTFTHNLHSTTASTFSPTTTRPDAKLEARCYHTEWQDKSDNNACKPLTVCDFKGGAEGGTFELSPAKVAKDRECKQVY